MAIVWTNQLSVGNRMIDAIHKEVFDMINRVVHSVKAKDQAALTEAFEQLENCLCNYFAVEEKVAQAIGFDFIKHRLAHQYLLNELKRIREELRAKNNAWSKFEQNTYIDLLRYCWIRHITEDAKPLKIVLETHFYDFKPEGLGGASHPG